MVTQDRRSVAWILFCLATIAAACGDSSTTTATLMLPETIEAPGPAATDTTVPALTIEAGRGGGWLQDLPSELFTGIGGGGEAFCPPPSNTPLPAMKVVAHSGYCGYLCLWGFSAGEAVHLEFYEPGGRLVAAKDIVVEFRPGYPSDSVEILLWFPGLPTGQWRAAADSSQANLEYAFTVSEPDAPMVSVMPGSAVDIFDGERWFYSDKNAYSADDRLLIFGAGLPVRQQLAFGIYGGGALGQVSPLVFRQWVTTDDQGHFSLVLSVDASWPVGRYCAVVLPQVEYNPWRGEYMASVLAGRFVITTD